MFWRYNLPTIAWAVLIFVTCSLPGKALPPSPFLSFDKFLHLIFFGILAFQMAVSLRRQFTYRKLRYYARKIAFVFGITYGILIEVFQEAFLQNRHFDLADWAADITGVLLGLLASRWIYREAW